MTITTERSADAVAADLGRARHVALKVHDNDPDIGEARWDRGARCRRRDIAISSCPEGSSRADAFLPVIRRRA